jgi:cellulose synthase/poly-beta-1,6-N-acetylglucosamine synthase-like glycosyltransferase
VTVTIQLVCAGLLMMLTVLGVYQWLLAFVSLLPRRARASDPNGARSRFLVLVPAHNEEAGLAPTLHSLQNIDYPRDATRIVVVADRCEDGTAAVARRCGVDCLERRDGPAGKGSAIAWAIDRLRQEGAEFDALAIVDADTVADPRLLAAFDRSLRAGHEAQQGYNYLSNPWDTPFTRIISVTSVLRNGLYYAGKERLGLPAMLTGTGMCFSRRLLERRGWTALSVGEDWEFSATLLLNREHVHFNVDARVMASESHGFRQASSQRLRWASGRHAVAGTAAMKLFKTGVRLRRPALCDAALTLIAPTYSAQATLAVACLVTTWFLPRELASTWMLGWAMLVTGLLASYFVLGMALTESPLRALKGVVLIPAFLPWRMAIEILGLLGFGRKRWVRTARLSEVGVTKPCR